MPSLEVTDLFTRLQALWPSLLLEPEVEFVRGSKVGSRTYVTSAEIRTYALVPEICLLVK